MLQVRENEISLRKFRWYCAFAQLRPLAGTLLVIDLTSACS